MDRDDNEILGIMANIKGEIYRLFDFTMPDKIIQYISVDMKKLNILLEDWDFKDTKLSHAEQEIESLNKSLAESQSLLESQKQTLDFIRSSELCELKAAKAKIALLEEELKTWRTNNASLAEQNYLLRSDQNTQTPDGSETHKREARTPETTEDISERTEAIIKSIMLRFSRALKYLAEHED